MPLVPVFFCIDNYLGTVKLVGGRSMQPTFNKRGKQNNDAVVLDRWSARTLAYRRGDVVVLRSPHAPDEMLTKRVVGLPGDWVRPRVAAHELSASESSQLVSAQNNVVHVPRGQLWVEGDNEASSNDSNGFGCISAALIEARVCFKLWPLSEAGVVENVEAPKTRLVHRGQCESMSCCVGQSKGMMPWHSAM